MGMRGVLAGFRLGARAVALAVAVALAAAVALAPAAAADERLQTSGTIAYSWRGDPGRGCARAGVCAVHGSLVVHPLGEADLSSAGPFGGELIFAGTSATVRVVNADGSTCVDQAGEVAFGLGLLSLTPKGNGSVAASFDQPPSSGRCAGPLAQDLAPVPVAGRRSRGRRPSLDFRGSAPFTAGPYSGTLASTLQLSPAPAGESGFSSSSSSGSSSSPALHPVLVEEIQLHYAVSTLPGGLNVSFAGENGPFCAALGSCGTSGSLTATFPSERSGLDLFASRIVRTPVGRRGVIADFRAGRLGFDGGPSVTLSGGRLDERLGNGAGMACADAVPLPDQQLSFGQGGPSHGRRIPVTLSGASGIDPLRTHCPGPEFTDVIGASQNYAQARIPVRQLLKRRSLVSLSTDGGFGGIGYDGTRGGAVRVQLSLLSVVAKTRRERVP